MAKEKQRLLESITQYLPAKKKVVEKLLAKIARREPTALALFSGEKVDMVCENSQQHLAVPRKLAHELGLPHRTANAVVLSADCEYLWLERRAHNQYPELTMTIPGGHLLAAETPEEAICCELRDELHLPGYPSGHLVSVCFHEWKGKNNLESRTLWLYKLTKGEEEAVQRYAKQLQAQKERSKTAKKFEKWLENEQKKQTERAEICGLYRVEIGSVFNGKGSLPITDVFDHGRSKERKQVRYTPDMLGAILKDSTLKANIMERIAEMKRFASQGSLTLGIPQGTRTIITAEGLSDSQQSTLGDIVRWKAADLLHHPIPSLKTLNHFFAEKTTFIFGESRQGEGGHLSSRVYHGAPTSDVVVCGDLLRLAARRGGFQLAIDEWQETKNYAASTNLVIVGSGVVNTYAYAINDFLPLNFDRSRAAKGIENAIMFDGKPLFGHHKEFDSPNYALVLFCNSPFSVNRRMLWIAGIKGIGTAAAAVCGKALAESSSRILHEFTHPIGCIVLPFIPRDRNPEQCRGGQRIRGCTIRAVLEKEGGGTRLEKTSIKIGE